MFNRNLVCTSSIADMWDYSRATLKLVFDDRGYVHSSSYKLRIQTQANFDNNVHLCKLHYFMALKLWLYKTYQGEHYVEANNWEAIEGDVEDLELDALRNSSGSDKVQILNRAGRLENLVKEWNRLALSCTINGAAISPSVDQPRVQGHIIIWENLQS